MYLSAKAKTRAFLTSSKDICDSDWYKHRLAVEPTVVLLRTRPSQGPVVVYIQLSRSNTQIKSVDVNSPSPQQRRINVCGQAKHLLSY